MSASPDLGSTPAQNAAAAASAAVCTVAASPHLSADHLSVDQLDDQLIGCLAAEPAAHLATCPLCTRRVAAAAAPLASFRHVATAWSDRRSATLTTPIHFRQRIRWQRHIGWATACLTVAVGIALTTTSQGWLAFTPSGPQPAMQQTTQQDATPQDAAQQDATPQDAAANPHVDQVSADNQMLQNIDSELDTSAETPSAFGLQAPNDQPAAPPTALQD